MPTVPIANPDRVQTQALPGVRVQAAANARELGAGIGQAMQRIGQQVEQVQTAQQDAAHRVEMKALEEANRAAVEDAFNRYQGAETSRLYDPKTGALNTRGRDALGVADTVFPTLDEDANEIESSLSNGRQKEVFRQAVAQRRVATARQVENHVAQQYAVLQKETHDAAIANSAADAARADGDPLIIGAAVARSRQASLALARFQGLDPEAAKAQATEAVTAVHGSAIESLAQAGRDQEALAYYQQHRGDLTANAVLRYGKVVEHASLQGDGQRAADGIIDSSLMGARQDNGLPDLSRAEQGAMDAAAKLDRPEVRALAEQRIQARFGQLRRLEDDRQEKVQGEIGEELQRTGGDLTAIDPARFSTLEPRRRVAMVNAAAAMARREDRTTDAGSRALYQATLSEAGSDADRKAFAEEDLWPLRQHLSASDFERLTKDQARVRIQLRDRKPPTTASSVIREATEGLLIQQGIDPREFKDGKVNSPRAVAFMAKMREVIDAAEAEPGRKAPLERKELEAIANRLLAKETVRVPGSLWGTNEEQVLAFEAPGAGAAVFSLAQVPSSYARAAEARGWNEDQTLAAYNAEMRAIQLKQEQDAKAAKDAADALKTPRAARIMSGG